MPKRKIPLEEYADDGQNEGYDGSLTSAVALTGSDTWSGVGAGIGSSSHSSLSSSSSSSTSSGAGFGSSPNSNGSVSLSSSMTRTSLSSSVNSAKKLKDKLHADNFRKILDSSLSLFEKRKALLQVVDQCIPPDSVQSGVELPVTMPALESSRTGKEAGTTTAGAGVVSDEKAKVQAEGKEEEVVIVKTEPELRRKAELTKKLDILLIELTCAPNDKKGTLDPRNSIIDNELLCDPVVLHCEKGSHGGLSRGDIVGLVEIQQETMGSAGCFQCPTCREDKDILVDVKPDSTLEHIVTNYRKEKIKEIRAIIEVLRTYNDGKVEAEEAKLAEVERVYQNKRKKAEKDFDELRQQVRSLRAMPQPSPPPASIPVPAQPALPPPPPRGRRARNPLAEEDQKAKQKLYRKHKKIKFQSHKLCGPDAPLKVMTSYKELITDYDKLYNGNIAKKRDLLHEKYEHLKRLASECRTAESKASFGGAIDHVVIELEELSTSSWINSDLVNKGLDILIVAEKFEQALKIWQKIDASVLGLLYLPIHYNYGGDIYKGLNQLPQALSSYEKCEAAYIGIFPPDRHPKFYLKETNENVKFLEYRTYWHAYTSRDEIAKLLGVSSSSLISTPSDTLPSSSAAAPAPLGDGGGGGDASVGSSKDYTRGGWTSASLPRLQGSPIHAGASSSYHATSSTEEEEHLARAIDASLKSTGVGKSSDVPVHRQ